MDEAKRELIKAWLIKAQNDLATARKLVRGPEIILDTAIYHCQQAAEKAIKAFLVFHDQRFEKTHDLRLLIELALRYNERLSDLQSMAELLTPYATAYRYPGDVLDPSQEEFDEALSSAESIYTFILSILPSSIHP